MQWHTQIYNNVRNATLNDSNWRCRNDEDQSQRIPRIINPSPVKLGNDNWEESNRRWRDGMRRKSKDPSNCQSYTGKGGERQMRKSIQKRSLQPPLPSPPPVSPLPLRSAENNVNEGSLRLHLAKPHAPRKERPTSEYPRSNSAEGSDKFRRRAMKRRGNPILEQWRARPAKLPQMQ